MTLTTDPSSTPPTPRRSGRVILASIGGLTVIVAVIIGAWAIGILGASDGVEQRDTRSAKSGAAPTWDTVHKRSFDLIVTASGELMAKNQVEMKNQVEGATRIVEIVPEGSTVTAGQVVVRLADDAIRDKIEQETLNVERARADQIAAEQAQAIQENQASSDQKAAQLKLELAQLDLKAWQKGADPQKQRELKLALDKAQRTLVRAKRDLELSKQLYEEKFVSLSELEDAEIAAIEAESALATAQLDIQVNDSYTRPKEERKAVSDVEQADAELERTIHKNQRDLERLNADLASKKQVLKIREESLAKLQRQLLATVMKAPQDGTVIYASSMSIGGRRGGNEPIGQGVEVRFNQTIIVLPDTRQMVAALRVHEALLTQIQLGQKVFVTIDAKPDRPFNGVVCQVAVTAEDGGWTNPDLREYLVKVELPPETDAFLKPSMRCSGQIFTGRVADTLAVPPQAITVEGRQMFCYVGSASSVRKQKVKVGRASDQLVEVLEGLQEGDRVLLGKPRGNQTVEGSPPTVHRDGD